MPSAFERLSIEDQSNLWAEAPDTPMHILAVLQVEPGALVDVRGHLKLDEIRRRIARRLERAPLLRQVVRPGTFLTGPPVWIDEVGFDLERHLRVGSIPAPGNEAELLEVVARIDEQRLNRSHALWEMWLLTGLSNGRIAIVLKLHHVIADGLAAVELMASFFAFTPDRGGDDGPVELWQPEAPPIRWKLMRDNATAKVGGLTRGLATIRRPGVIWRTARTTVHALLFLAAQAKRAPRCSINRPIGPGRRLTVIRIPLEEAKAVAHSYGGKVNDLLLAVVAGGLRALLLNRGESIEGLKLMTSVPVSMRHDSKLGNEVGVITVPLAIDGPDPRAQLEGIVRATHAAKKGQSAATGTMAFSQMARFGLARILSRRQRYVNLFITNVAGPPIPVHVLGGRLLDVIPVVPIAGNCTLGFGALSYNGCLAITAVADADQVSDLDEVIRGMDRSWSALSLGIPRGERGLVNRSGSRVGGSVTFGIRDLGPYSPRATRRMLAAGFIRLAGLVGAKQRIQEVREGAL
jgi:diacylglycerol O-acyltransferase